MTLVTLSILNHEFFSPNTWEEGGGEFERCKHHVAATFWKNTSLLSANLELYKDLLYSNHVNSL